MLSEDAWTLSGGKASQRTLGQDTLRVGAIREGGIGYTAQPTTEVDVDGDWILCQ